LGIIVEIALSACLGHVAAVFDTSHSAAWTIAAFYDQDLLAGVMQVVRRGQARDASANHEGVEFFHGHDIHPTGAAPKRRPRV